MIYARYVKVALGKPQTGRVKSTISSGTGEAKFLLGKGKKNPLGRVSLGLLQRGVLLRPETRNSLTFSLSLFEKDQQLPVLLL